MTCSAAKHALVLSLSLAVCVVASAAPAYMKLGDIKGECQMSEQALLELKSAQPQPVALLLPAVQKVREAAARARSSCVDQRDPEGCMAGQLSSQILASDDGRDPALSLLDLYARGSGKHYKEAKLSVRKAGDDRSNGAAADMISALAAGLVSHMEAAKMPASVIDPMRSLQGTKATTRPAAPVGG